MRTDRPLQTIVGLFLLLVGLAFYAFHLWQHQGGACGDFDGDVKVALGIGGVGLLLLPFDFSNLRRGAAVARGRLSGTFKAPSGGDSPPSGNGS